MVVSGGSPRVRPSRLHRMSLRGDYAWRHGPAPAVNRWHAAWDAGPLGRRATVRSVLGGITLDYTGPAEDVSHAVDFTERRRGDGPATRTRPSTALPDGDLLLVGTTPGRAAELPRHASLVLPARVHLVADIDADADTVHRRVSRREREQFGRDRRAHDWTWEQVRDDAWFDEFYRTCYRPTMRRRHGDHERVESAELAHECLYRTGRLFALSQDGERIGGALCHWDPAGGLMTSRLLGVRDGDEKHYRSGAFKALYHFMLRWSAEHGVRRLDLQGTEPFLSAGTFQWKRRFGTRVELPANHFGHKRLWLQVRRDTPPVRDFLVANPVLVQAGDGLEAVYFSDRSRPPQRQHSARSPGISAVRDVDLDHFLAGLPTPSPHDLVTAR